MHNIEYYSFPEKVDREKVQNELDEHAAFEDRYEGCSGLDSPIRWLERVGIFDDYDKAREGIAANDRNWYDQLAVRYRDKNGAVKWLVKIEYHT